MTNLTRVTGKVFGETASPTGDVNNGPYIGQFGSAKAGTYNGTDDVATIQSLPAWSNGFIDAVTPSQQFPTLPEMTGVCKDLSYQECYILQKGIAEWDSGTTYYTNDFCRVAGTVYQSTYDNNTNHNPTSHDGYWSIYTGNNSQVTNCLLEVPNNIKLELENGTLTLKAGSKVIVPNGFEQDGVTPKFDEVIIENDITNTTTNLASVPYMTAITPDGQTLHAMRYDRVVSGATDSITGVGHWWYDTTNNLVKRIDASNVLEGYASFPVSIGNRASSGTAGWIFINQVFNGFGYIGGVMWADKGIKCLIPNGRNADGSLNNTEYTLPSLIVRDKSSLTAGNHTLQLGMVSPYFGTFYDKICYYDAEKNYNFYTDNGMIVIFEGSFCGSIRVESGVITSFTVQNALNLNSMCDGQWVDSYLALASGVTIPTTTDKEYDLSSYLPNDGYNYEVIFSGRASTASTSGSSSVLYISSSRVSDVYICQAATRTNNQIDARGSVIVPIGTDRKVTVMAYATASGVFYLYAKAYRRIGTNF